MRVCSYRAGEEVRVGLAVDDDHIVDVGPGDLRTLVESGAVGLEQLRAVAATADQGPVLALADLEVLAPYRPLQNLLVADGNSTLAGGKPKESVPPISYYGRAPSAVIAPGQPISWPAYLTDEVYVEPQLGIVIGSPLSYVSADDALAGVFGYAVVSAVSARNLRTKHAQLMKSGSLDSFIPWGPFMTTADEVTDPDGLAVELAVNGEVVYEGSTGDAHRSVSELLAEITTGITLQPGDVVVLGSSEITPLDGRIDRYLAAGDVVESRIAGVGSITNPVADPY